MAGDSPTLDETEVKRPTKKYKVTFQPQNVTIEVDPADLPYGRHGLAGSILDIAEQAGVKLDHACGGVCACSTCHVIVRQGLETCNEASEDEEDQLDDARGLTVLSRLGCQCVPDGTTDVVIEVPSWNRNLASEHDH